MTGEDIFMALAGIVATYVGCRFVAARQIPIVSEDDQETYGWIRGREAVVAGGLVIALGLTLLAAAFGLVTLHF